MYETLLIKPFHQISINFSATVFRCIFVNHRVVLELEQVSSEIAEDDKHEDAGRHHSSNLKEEKMVRGKRTGPRAHQYVFVSDRPPLY